MLGKRVKDITSNLEGIVVVRSEHLSGLIEYGIQLPMVDHNKDIYYVQESYLEVLEDSPFVDKIELGFIKSNE